MKHSNFALVIIVAALAAHTHAHAQSATAQAETLFRQGKDLMSKGRFAEACAAFDASQKLEPTIATLLNQASCREKNGQLATAWGLFIDAERQSRAATDGPTQQLHQVANDHAAKLEHRLSTLTISVAPENRVGGLEILRNNEPVDPGAWNKPLPVDGGTYRVTARAPGNTDWSSSITIGNERDAKGIDIPKLKAAAVALRPSSPVATPSPQPRTTSEVTHRSNILPLALGGAAVALGGVALGFELSARSTYDKSKAEADDAKQKSLYDSANTRRHVAIGLGVAGVACAGAAVWLYLRGTSTETTSTSIQARRLLLEPVISSNQAGLLLTGQY